MRYKDWVNSDPEDRLKDKLEDACVYISDLEAEIDQYKLMCEELVTALEHSINKHDAGCASVMEALEEYGKLISTSS